MQNISFFILGFITPILLRVVYQSFMRDVIRHVEKEQQGYNQKPDRINLNVDVEQILTFKN